MTSDAAETGSATNGQQTVYPPKTTFPLLSGSSQSLTYGGQGVGISNGTGPGASCSASATIGLTFTVTGTWQGPGPCPSTVYLLETSSALYHGYAQDGSTSSQNNPSAADGLGDPAIPTDPLSGTSTGTQVTSVPVTGNSWTITRTLSGASNCTANFPPTSGGGGMEADAGIGGYTVRIFPTGLLGYSTVDTAGWDPMHPRFFSGTDCSATGTAVAASGYVTQAALSIGGTTVKSYYDNSFIGPVPPAAARGMNQASVPLSVFFDSTYFADASTIPAKMTVTDSGGFTYSVNISGPACNKLTAVANNTISWFDVYTHENVALNAAKGIAKGQSSDQNYQPCPGVVPQSQAGNISIGSSPIINHHRTDLINDIAAVNQTIFFSANHADPGLLGDCYSLADSNYAAYLDDDDIQGAIATRTRALSAPYLFVFLHGCDGGDASGLAVDFGLSTGSSNDTAFVGYDITIAVNQRNTNFAVTLWQYLMQGKTVTDAKQMAFNRFKVQRYIDQNTPPNDNPGNTQFPVIYGDDQTTLYGKVYNWVSGPTWYR